mmetsp:Transcript_2757/g.5299  ORF Transcript_2757/g.5299 Transcript_2757/m.5299 type:complete len:260 (-) Transcript_2757:12-791(-)
MSYSAEFDRKRSLRGRFHTYQHPESLGGHGESLARGRARQKWNSHSAQKPTNKGILKGRRVRYNSFQETPEPQPNPIVASTRKRVGVQKTTEARTPSRRLSNAMLAQQLMHEYQKVTGNVGGLTRQYAVQKEENEWPIPDSERKLRLKRRTPTSSRRPGHRNDLTKASSSTMDYIDRSNIPSLDWNISAVTQDGKGSPRVSHVMSTPFSHKSGTSSRGRQSVKSTQSFHRKRRSDTESPPPPPPQPNPAPLLEWVTALR